MIGSLRGKVLQLEEGLVLLEVGQVGYEVEMSGRDLAKLTVGQEVFCYIHHAVREDAQSLYGFLELPSRALFRLLIKISGIGPKVALATLSTFEATEFVSVVLAGQAAQLRRISGVGSKTAERMVVELKDRLKDFRGSELAGSTASSQLDPTVYEDTLSALQALGYRQHECLRALEAVQAPGKQTEELIVAALALLAKKA